ARGALLAAGAARGRARAAGALVPLLPLRLHLRRHLGDPADDPRRAGARSAAGAVMESTDLVGTRVLLRPFRLDDVDAVLAYASDPEVTRYLEWDAYDDPETAAAFIRSTLSAGSTWIARAITLRETGAVIGGG